MDNNSSDDTQPLPPPIDPDREAIQKQCYQFLESTGVRGFIVFGWHKADGSVDVVLSMKEVEAIAGVKAIAWTMNEFTKAL